MPIWIVGCKLPPGIRAILVNAIPSRRVQRMKHLVTTIRKRSEEIIAKKRAALQKSNKFTMHQVEEGKDIMSILRACALHKNHTLCSLGTGFESLTFPQCKQT